MRNGYGLIINHTGARHAEHLPNAAAGLSAKQQEQVLDARYRDIQDCLNLDEIFPHLCQHHLLTSAEKQELLNPMYTSNHKIHKLITWIPRKGCDALHRFIICLKHSADGTGHLELADTLEKQTRKGRQYTTKKGIRCLPCCQTVVPLVKVVGIMKQCQLCIALLRLYPSCTAILVNHMNMLWR